MVATGFAADSAMAQSRSDQREARKEMKAGNSYTVDELARRIVPGMERKGWTYMTFEYDSARRAYRFKFIRKGRVMFVDMDERTGKEIRRTS